MTLARFVLLAVLGLAPAALAQESMRIAAIVNDEAISFMDLEDRLRLVLISSNVGDTPENRARASAQILRQLVDERLQLQEGKRLGVEATEDDIKDAFRTIEQQGNMPPGGLEEEIKQAGVSRVSLIEQLRATIVWQKLMRRQLAPKVQVGDDEVEEIIGNIKKTSDQPELRLLEIQLGIDRPDREAEIRRFAEQLTEQARGGTDFGGLARQFSESVSAAVNGEIGWVLPNQLDEAIERELAKASPGDVVGPIRTVAGYQIVKLAERRALEVAKPDEATVNLRQAMFAIAGASEEEKRQQAAPLAAAKSCPDFEKLAEEAKASPPYSLGRLKIGDLNASIKSTVAALGAGQISSPARVADSIVVFMVCDKIDPPSNMPTADQVRDQIFRGKLAIVARRYLRDLRRAAYLDFRT